jgi:hypothetical protein
LSLAGTVLSHRNAIEFCTGCTRISLPRCLFPLRFRTTDQLAQRATKGIVHCSKSASQDAHYHLFNFASWVETAFE